MIRVESSSATRTMPLLTGMLTMNDICVVIIPVIESCGHHRHGEGPHAGRIGLGFDEEKVTQQPHNKRPAATTQQHPKLFMDAHAVNYTSPSSP